MNDSTGEIMLTSWVIGVIMGMILVGFMSIVSPESGQDTLCRNLQIDGWNTIYVDTTNECMLQLESGDIVEFTVSPLSFDLEVQGE